MKKLLTLLCALLLCFSLSACGSTSDNSSSSETKERTVGVGGQTLLDYEEKGYQMSSAQVYEDCYVALYFCEDPVDYIEIVIPMTSDDYNDLNNLDMMADDYFEQYDAIIYSLNSEATVTSLNDQVPSQDVLDKYVGMTVQEVLDNYSNGSYSWDVTNTEDFTVHCGFATASDYSMIFNLVPEIPEGFTLDDDNVGTLVIKSVSFYCFQ